MSDMSSNALHTSANLKEEWMKKFIIKSFFLFVFMGGSYFSAYKALYSDNLMWMVLMFALMAATIALVNLMRIDDGL